MKLCRTSAFSLVELSIVLVILGLLVGGVLTGQSLIRAAELRSVTTELNFYVGAVNSFRDRFFATPGDMRNATDFWGNADTGSAGGACAAPATDTGSGTQTCNGDGDGRVGTNSGTTQVNERFRFWQHLANAGLIEGSFTGVADSGGTSDHTAGLNSPVARLSSNVTWGAFDWEVSGHSQVFDGDYSNSLRYGGDSGTSVPTTGALTAEESWNIDTKIDDGMPAVGIVVLGAREFCSNTTNAAADSDNFDAEYTLSSDDRSCHLVFRGVY